MYENETKPKESHNDQQPEETHQSDRPSSTQDQQIIKEYSKQKKKLFRVI
jgi:hypothetical protein